MSGIYQIYNPINNKRYIGSSINVERRLKEHLRNLEKNRHCNDHLQSAYNKYKDVLQFQFKEIIDKIRVKTIERYKDYRNKKNNIFIKAIFDEEANDLEKYYIAFYKSNDRKYGYNILEGGDSKIVPEERRVNLTKVKHGKNKGKVVLVFNLNKEYVGEFVSSYQAAKILNCDQGHIRKCCQCKEGRKQHKGYIFKYKEEL
jgi:hypothetical protein